MLPDSLLIKNRLASSYKLQPSKVTCRFRVQMVCQILMGSGIHLDGVAATPSLHVALGDWLFGSGGAHRENAGTVNQEISHLLGDT